MKNGSKGANKRLLFNEKIKGIKTPMNELLLKDSKIINKINTSSNELAINITQENQETMFKSPNNEFKKLFQEQN